MIKKLLKIYCVLFGHSRIVDIWFGRISCARCGEQLVDGLTQAIDPYFEEELVYRKCPHGPDCTRCADNMKNLKYFKDIFGVRYGVTTDKVIN